MSACEGSGEGIGKADEVRRLVWRLPENLDKGVSKNSENFVAVINGWFLSQLAKFVSIL